MNNENRRFCLPRYGMPRYEALLSAGYEISAIFTHTDNPVKKPFMVRWLVWRRKEAFRLCAG